MVDNDADYAEWCANKMKNHFIKTEMGKLLAQKVATPLKVMDQGDTIVVQVPDTEDDDLGFFDQME